MLKKSKLLLSLLGVLFVGIFVLNFVSAYWSSSFVGSIDRAVYNIQPVAQFFLGGYDYTGYMLFERFLVFLLILSVTFIALSKAPFFSDQKNVVMLLSFVIPLMSVRYINFEWLNTIMLSYQVFGIALTAFIPFVIYFFFLMGVAPDHAIVRKVGWVFFLCVYLGLYTTSADVFYGKVYMWTALVALVFLLADGTIARAMMWNKIKESGKSTIQQAEISVRRKMKELSDDLNAGVIDQKYFYKQMAVLKKQQKTLFKHTT